MQLFGIHKSGDSNGPPVTPASSIKFRTYLNSKGNSSRKLTTIDDSTTSDTNSNSIRHESKLDDHDIAPFRQQAALGFATEEKPIPPGCRTPISSGLAPDLERGRPVLQPILVSRWRSSPSLEISLRWRNLNFEEDGDQVKTWS
jgi:hypothetical protein